jgi:hypothetical protein
MEIVQHGTFKGDLLLEELLVSYPQLIVTDADGERRQLVDVGTMSDMVQIAIPDALGILEADIQEILDAHDPTQPSAGEIEIEKRTASLQAFDRTEVGSALASIEAARTAVADADLAALKGIVDSLLQYQRQVIDALQYLVE